MENKYKYEKKNSPILEGVNVHNLTYPYHNVDPVPIIDYARTVERNYLILDILTEEQTNISSDFKLLTHTFDAIQFGLRYLKDTVYLNIKQSEFIDCLGYCAVPCLFASSFGFQTVKSIECNEEGLQIAKTLYDKLNSLSPEKNTKMKFYYGSMQDYFSYDANVLYLDTNIICRDTMFDEGVLIDLFFRLCKRLIPGSYLIVVTFCLCLFTRDCIDLGFDYIEFLNKHEIPYGEGGGTKTLHVWILKVTNPLPKIKKK